MLPAGEGACCVLESEGSCIVFIMGPWHKQSQIYDVLECTYRCLGHVGLYNVIPPLYNSYLSVPAFIKKDHELVNESNELTFSKCSKQKPFMRLGLVGFIERRPDGNKRPASNVQVKPLPQFQLTEFGNESCSQGGSAARS